MGEYASGEGQLSLAYGFSYAGCGSTINTLWPVDNQTNSELVELLLANLADGLPRAEALRQAQLDFLATAPAEQQHPFYWASMIAQGRDGPLEIQRRWSWWWGYGLVGGLLLALAAVFLWQK